jgi:hypothetical protein
MSKIGSGERISFVDPEPPLSVPALEQSTTFTTLVGDKSFSVISLKNFSVLTASSMVTDAGVNVVPDRELDVTFDSITTALV